MTRRKSPISSLVRGRAARIANEIRLHLRKGGSTNHSAGVQKFFKNAIKSRGWYTADLRKSARQLRDKIQKDYGSGLLVQVADALFTGNILEEKIYAVFLLEKLAPQLTDAEFVLFQTWLSRISSWADHDALVHYLIAPMIVANAARRNAVFHLARSPDPWQRRAACVSLIRSTREKSVFHEVVRLANLLLDDENEMVQKGLGWLLRETAKADADQAIPYLKIIRERAPRLVLRTACETLPAHTRRRILAR